MHELRNVGELKALLLNGDRIPLQEWGIYGERFDDLIDRVRKEAKAEGWDAFVDMLEDQRADWKKPVIEIYPNPFRADQIEGNE